MVTQNSVVLSGLRCTLDEFLAILDLRLSTLADATAQVTGDGPLPVGARHGWKATYKVLGRSQDGSLLVEIRCTGPWQAAPYTRKCRLVREQRLKVS